MFVDNQGWSLDDVAKGEVIEKVDISLAELVLKEALDNLLEGGENGQQMVISNHGNPLDIFSQLALD